MLMKKINLLLVLIVLFTAPIFGQTVKVAVAANLQAVIKELRADFKNKTGIAIEPIVGSSGNLTAQVKNGAPFDVFLSADMNFPETLFKDGFSSKKPVVYAQGSLIICSNQDIGFENWERLLLTERVKKIAIANPAHAPYGKRAKESLQYYKLYNKIQGKLVLGENISQTAQFITTGAADIGVVALSLALSPAMKNEGGKYYLIPEQSHTPLEQAYTVLKHAEGNSTAAKFYNFISSPAAIDVLKYYGFSQKK